jgi:hypothetical protein
MKVSILFYFSPPSQLDRPQYDGFAFPLHSLTFSRSILSHCSRSSMYLVGCCIQLLIGGRLKPRWILFYFYFALQFDGRNDETAYSPIVIALWAVLPHHPIVVANFWLVVVSPHPLEVEAIETHGPNFFVAQLVT